MTKCLLSVALSVALCSARVAHAAVLTIGPTEVVKIAPGGLEEPPRYLVAVPVPDALGGATIDFGRLSLRAQVEGPRDDSVFVLQMYALTTEWNAGTVGWNTPWEDPGGDVDEHTHMCCVAAPSDTVRANLDVTHILQSWVDGDLANSGMLLMVPEGSGHTVTAVDCLYHPPRVIVYYTPRD